MIVATTVQAGGLLEKLYFIGLWQGVDDLDGSESQRSITINSDGTFNIIGFEPYTSGCEGERGKITGTGMLEEGVIVSNDFTLTCYNDLGPFTVIQAEYKPDKLNGTLIEQVGGGDFPSIIFHKISNR
jgi:hypothetical protein